MLSETTKSSNTTELVATVPADQLTEEEGSSSLSNATLPPAEKLVRSRRHPSWRHGSKRSKRRRVKGPPPKIRYGPPSHLPGPPISYTHYKPHSLPPSLPPSFATHIEEPSYSIEDFQHLKFDAADFHIPASSYEAQSMDLNLYSHEDNDIYGAHKFPSLEYTFTEDHHDSPAPPSSSYEHTPHQKYGVPPLQQSIGPSSYEPESYVSHHYVPPPAHAAPAPPSTHYGPPPSTKYGAPPSTKYGAPPPTKYGAPPSTKYGAPPSTHYGAPPSAPPSSHYGVPAAPPSTQYGVPSAPAHVPSYSHVEPPPPPDSYSIYEQKIPNAGYHEQSFAEPPKSAPPPHNSNYEIAYSPPAYEISTSYQAHDTQYEQNYQPPSSGHDGHFAEPPQHAPPPQHTPSYTPEHPQQHPPQQPPPQHPPPQHPPPQHPSSNYVQPEQHQPVQSYPQDDYALPSEELPINPNPKFPSFDFPKSSYEVPIYDPIPFESSNKKEQESYPPILPDHTSNDLPSDAQTAGSSHTTARSRKRKRRPSVVSKKHTLDVPELQQAYDADSHVQVARGTELDTVAHGSHYVQHKRTYSNFVTPSTTTSTTTTPAPWSPMRHRSTANSAFVPTIVTSTSSPHLNRNRGTSRYRSRTASTEPTAVTIEKSRSQSYYDGTIAPPTYQQQQHQYFGGGGRGSSSRPTRPPRGGATGASLALQPGATERNPTHKRTTKGVFDTTLFKSPQSDREMERKLNILRQNLPKNHKLY